MDAALPLHRSVSVFTTNGHRDRLDTRFFALGYVLDRDVEPGIGEVSLIHAGKHLGPVLGVHPTCSGMHCHDRRVVVILIEEKRLALQEGKAFLDRGELGIDFSPGGYVVGLIRQIKKDFGIVEAGCEATHSFQCVLDLS